MGVSVTNALARRMQVTVYRDGQVATIVFAGGDVVEPLALLKAGAGDAGRARRCASGRAEYFDSVDLPRADLTHLLRSKAVLMPGVTVTLTVEKSGDTQRWLYKGGLRDYLMQTLAAEPLVPLFDGEQYATGAGPRTWRRARAQPGAWPSPRTARRCARATST